MILSIIIPTYNSSKTIRKCLESIIYQSFKDWEVLVIDGLSTDNTIYTAKTYEDNRIRIFSEPDYGIYDAMNKGIKLAKGEWVYFLGSDDYLINNQVLNEVFVRNLCDFDVVYGEVESDNLSPRNGGEWTFSNLEYNRCHQAIFYRRTIFQKFGLYNIKYKSLADYDLNLKWFLNTKINNIYLPIIIAHYSMGGYSSMHEDNNFHNDYYLNCLLYGGYKVFPINLRIYYGNKALRIQKGKWKRRCLRILIKIWTHMDKR